MNLMMTDPEHMVCVLGAKSWQAAHRKVFHAIDIQDLLDERDDHACWR